MASLFWESVVQHLIDHLLNPCSLDVIHCHWIESPQGCSIQQCFFRNPSGLLRRQIRSGPPLPSAVFSLSILTVAGRPLDIALFPSITCARHALCQCSPLPVLTGHSFCSVPTPALKTACLHFCLSFASRHRDLNPLDPDQYAWARHGKLGPEHRPGEQVNIYVTCSQGNWEKTATDACDLEGIKCLWMERCYVPASAIQPAPNQRRPL